MKILIYTDVHWCKYSSIVRENGVKYSTRLENLISTMNWLEHLALEKGCLISICAGDFFDKPELSAMELTALNHVEWDTELEHYFVVGNHEIEQGDDTISTTHLFSLIPNSYIIDKPSVKSISRNLEIGWLPYILESDRKPINEYLQFNKTKRNIIISHNDIKGIQLGPWFTQTGFDIKDIEANCDLCFNGHIHNRGQVGAKTYNVGNITGLNFNEDAELYRHGAIILDADTLEWEFIENPYALNFYKIDETLENKVIPEMNRYSVVTWKAFESNVQRVKDRLRADYDVLASRVLVIPELNNELETTESLAVDHLQKFKEFILTNIGADTVTLQEIEEIVK